jgi:succinyl-CoA synthetase alpha subunit
MTATAVPPHTLTSRSYPNLYKDSVSLMTVSAQILGVPGIVTASVVMGSATNVENLAQAGLGEFEVRPNDLIVAVSGTDEGCAEALARADDLLTSRGTSDDGAAPAAAPVVSLQMAVARDPSLNLALISVPGDYAAAEAMKALRLSMDVMIFSDNVPPEAELAIKEYARERDLMVMGPDCGTSIVNGVPLGFANVVRRGSIGVVGASGTGTQEVTVCIHRNGSGVSHALGTGGHDLAEAIGGISMLHGLAALDADPATDVIVLVSKPPAADVAAKVLAAAEESAKPVVVIFLGADPVNVTRRGVHGAKYLAGAAEMAVALARGEEPRTYDLTISNDMRRTIRDLARAMAPSQKFVRGIFSGGTFCFEAQLIHAAQGIVTHSNVPIDGNVTLADIARSHENTIVDMGDDEFTQGRPHPMIDPSLRDARIGEEIDDPTTAVVLFDVVLGYGSASDPTAELLGVIGSARARARADGRAVAFVAYVCGTDLDPQDRASVVAGLKSAGVHVASSNAEAAVWSAAIVSELGGGAA